MPRTSMRELAVVTDDGVCPTYLHTPGDEQGGPWPCAVLYMDAPGIRPALHEMAARLAGAGYAVALPDLFYRAGPYAPVDPKRVFTDPALRAEHRARFNATATSVNVMADTRALLATLAATPDVAPGPIGVVGYCMGGRLALLAAGTFPDRIAAAASFHAGGLANDAPDSPHQLAGAMRAKVYVAGAIEDDNFPDDMKARLDAALSEAGVEHLVETYPARHGWVPSDTPAHDAVQAEHHWSVLIPLLDGVLKRP